MTDKLPLDLIARTCIALADTVDMSKELTRAEARITELEARIAKARALAQAEMDYHMDGGRLAPYLIRQALDGKETP